MDKSSSVSFNNTSKAFKGKSNFELFKTYCLFLGMNKPLFTNIGTFSIKFLLKTHFPVKFFIKPTLFKQFCGGETLQECKETIEKLWNSQIGSILDYSVEGESNEESFELTAKEIIKNITLAHNNPAIPFCVFKLTGISSMSLLEKIQQKKGLTDPDKTALKNLQNRLSLIAETASKQKVKILIDAEESWIQDTIDDLAYDLMSKYNQTEALIFNTIQLYRTDRLQHIHQIINATSIQKYIAGFKLVRGAYMEKERKRAQEKSLPDPIHPDKTATDLAFDEALKICIKNIDRVHICVGSHNEASNLLLTQLMKEYKLNNKDPRICFAQLYGMSDHISYNLSDAGYQVAKYVPYGAVEKVMPYLFRRAQENTSITGQTSRELKLLKQEKNRRKV